MIIRRPLAHSPQELHEAGETLLRYGDVVGHMTAQHHLRERPRDAGLAWLLAVIALVLLSGPALYFLATGL